MKKLFFGIFTFTFVTSLQAGIGANINVASDYVWRGQSYSNNAAVVQGGLDFSTKVGVENLDFIAGTWGSNVVEDTELDFYAGTTYSFSEELSFTLKYFYYNYVKAYDDNTHEVIVATEYSPIDLISIIFDLNYTPDFFDTDSNCFYVHIAPTVNLPWSTYITLNAGYSYFGDEEKVEAKFGNGESYFDYSLTLGKSIEDGFSYSVTLGDASESHATTAYISLAKSI